ncbi:hypothetical protein llap_2386 [Limosa lapponica baueri]|uniref:Uncharacterized protein n=1 Tax=Limosa lapponica baueri TaxID=1758121 RepID=A0A2I0UMM1_LIMLA|nr:hypothetical protein llap_2386 [Limosa lapponica baueri]
MEEAEDCKERGTESGTEPPVSLRLWSALCTTLFGSLGIDSRLNCGLVSGWYGDLEEKIKDTRGLEDLKSSSGEQ